ncbi:MAG: sulfatase, partial [Bacillota bacterium]
MKRPNILLIHTDQQRWDALGINGNQDIHTPNLDRLGKEGINFDHYFVNNPVCMPSRVSYLSGLYPSTLGIYRNGVPVSEDLQVLPKMLSPYGYVTANIGKLHFLNHANRDHKDPHPDYGFDHLEISDEPGCYDDAYRAWVRRKAPEQLDKISVGLPPATETWQEAMNIDDNINHPEERFPKKPVPFKADSDLTHSAFVAEQTVEFLKKHQDENFFCAAGFYSPHSPWVAPQEYIDKYNPEELSFPSFPETVDSKRSEDYFSDEELKLARQGYYAMVSEVDYQVGKILSELENLGLRDNTIVIFTSDHGEYLGDHLRYGKGTPGYDCVSRVPLIIRWPEVISETGTFSGLAEAVDLVPTILESAGIQIPYRLQGKSLYPVLTGEKSVTKDTTLLEGEGVKTLRTRDYRYVVKADGKEMLFDLKNDPGEYNN